MSLIRYLYLYQLLQDHAVNYKSKKAAQNLPRSLHHEKPKGSAQANRRQRGKFSTIAWTKH